MLLKKSFGFSNITYLLRDVFHKWLVTALFGKYLLTINKHFFTTYKAFRKYALSNSSALFHYLKIKKHFIYTSLLIHLGVLGIHLRAN